MVHFFGVGGVNPPVEYPPLGHYDGHIRKFFEPQNGGGTADFPNSKKNPKFDPGWDFCQFVTLLISKFSGNDEKGL